MIRLLALFALLLAGCTQAGDRPTSADAIPAWICIHDSPFVRTCFTRNEVAQVIECSGPGTAGTVRLVFLERTGHEPVQFAFQDRRYYSAAAYQPPPPGGDQLAFFTYGDELLVESFEPCTLAVIGGAA
ncbi:MAG: hypothetical protein LW860_16405 [Xanthomonadaceae bacterium]|jgi:hypothetical protein|nr:hypothetical protein [Xanthomonadaceae bacterium]